MRNALIPALLVCVLAPAASALAQAPASTTPAAPAAARPMFTVPKENPVPSFEKFMYTMVSGFILKSAEKMPEENFSFKPTADVRSYGEILGHIADASYMFCSTAAGEKNPSTGKIEGAKTSRADLTAALKDAFAYCGKVYAGTTDASGAQPVKMMGMDAPKEGVLIVNITHTMEHYGNLVTYMRMKNIVPPTSDQGGMSRP
jgi:uncharacterized damage-inducible protein DinB